MRERAGSTVTTIRLRKVIIVIFVGILSLAPDIYTQSLDGFLGIEWGASLAEAQTIMLQKPGMILDSDLNAGAQKSVLPNGLIMRFFTGPFSGHNSGIALAFLDSAGFFKAIVMYKGVKRHEVISTWKELRNRLTQKYGTPEIDHFRFVSPYYEGDGYEEQAIQNGKGIAIVAWTFTDGNSIVCEIDDELTIMIVYENSTVATTAKSRFDSDKLDDL